jgi:hypothetical protein
MDPDEEEPQEVAPLEGEDVHTDIECDCPPPPLKWTKPPWAWREAMQEKAIRAHLTRTRVSVDEASVDSTTKRFKGRAVAKTKSSKGGK